MCCDLHTFRTIHMLYMTGFPVESSPARNIHSMPTAFTNIFKYVDKYRFSRHISALHFAFHGKNLAISHIIMNTTIPGIPTWAAPRTIPNSIAHISIPPVILPSKAYLDIYFIVLHEIMILKTIENNLFLCYNSLMLTTSYWYESIEALGLKWNCQTIWISPTPTGVCVILEQAFHDETIILPCGLQTGDSALTAQAFQRLV